MENKNTIGVINEQGFVAGYGLGFNTLNEQDQKKLRDNKKDKENKEKE